MKKAAVIPAEIASPVKLAAEQAAVRPTDGTARFTRDGSVELEHRLAITCGHVLDGVRNAIPRHKLEALLLGGGYGRGEGGVFKTETGDRPYNDLEFYVFVHGSNWRNEQKFGRALRRLAHGLEPAAGVEVEFKIISSAKLRRSPASMFYYDLVVGHRRLLGETTLLAGCEHHCDARNIPLSEAAWLLMNRCTGLLLAREKLGRASFAPTDADFVCRNIAKAQLAFGDAVLTAFGRYHWSCLKRQERLMQFPVGNFPWPDALRQHHAEGVEFKLHPRRTPSSRVALRMQHERVTSFALETWLWLENIRLGANFTSARDYALFPGDKCPETSPWRNLLVSAKVFGPVALLSKRSRRHPRERILNALALLLWEPSACGSEMRIRLCDELRRSANTNPVRMYQELWRKFS